MARNSDIEKGKGDCTRVPVIHTEATLRTASPLPKTCCIFRVPQVLRRQKKAEYSYEPDIVSIGPFHRGHAKFNLVENVKKWYLNCLLTRLKMSFNELMMESIKGIEEDSRACYEGPACNEGLLDQDAFIEMLILDGCFLIEIFRKGIYETQRDPDDPIFSMSCMLEYLYHDLLLLENQLPWAALDSLHNVILRHESPDYKLTIQTNLIHLVIDFFKQSVADPKIFNYPTDPYPNTPVKVFHVLDLIRLAIVENYEKENVPEKESHLPRRIPNASALSDSSVSFQKGENGCIMNITFNNGVFVIPPLAIDERTGPLFRNLIAYEQCMHSILHKITSYAVLMDNLIDSNKDVDMLCEEGILVNWLSAEDASMFFNDLYTDTTVIGYIYKDLCGKVHKHHGKTWNRWMAKLKSDYFSTPWAVISFIAAFILLVLTVMQTVCTLSKCN